MLNNKKQNTQKPKLKSPPQDPRQTCNETYRLREHSPKRENSSHKVISRATGCDGAIAVIGEKNLRTNRFEKASAEREWLFSGMQTDTNADKTYLEALGRSAGYGLFTEGSCRVHHGER